MNALTTKQRTKINAALTIADSAGVDVAPLQARANQLIASGRTPNAAYDAVFEPLLKSDPVLGRDIGRYIALIDASDSNTVARYDQALSAYIRTGDDSALATLDPMVRQDMVALAVKTGEISTDDASSGNINWEGIGLTQPDEASRFEFKVSAPAQTLAPQAPPADPYGGMYDAPARFSQPPATGASPNLTGGVRVGAGWDKHNASHSASTSGPSPYAGMNPAQIKEAMAKDYGQQTGWQREALD